MTSCILLLTHKRIIRFTGDTCVLIVGGGDGGVSLQTVFCLLCTALFVCRNPLHTHMQHHTHTSHMDTCSTTHTHTSHITHGHMQHHTHTHHTWTHAAPHTHITHHTWTHAAPNTHITHGHMQHHTHTHTILPASPSLPCAALPARDPSLDSTSAILEVDVNLCLTVTSNMCCLIDNVRNTQQLLVLLFAWLFCCSRNCILFALKILFCCCSFLSFL